MIRDEHDSIMTMIPCVRARGEARREPRLVRIKRSAEGKSPLTSKTSARFWR